MRLLNEHMARPGARPTFFASPAEFRSWLDSSHDKCGELWVGFRKKSSGRPSITYPEAVDEALCFGWIDGVRHSVERDAYTIRFTPRKTRSQWSAINIRRAKELAGQGRMHAAGLKAFTGAENQPRKYSYEQREKASLDCEQERRFRACPEAWDFFQSQPPWYRRTATFWVISAKKEETRQKRLATLIEDSRHRRPIKPMTRPVPKRQKKR